jgi:hypothetical protein
VEVKLVEESVWNIRCPGEGCRYRLLAQDISMALEKSSLRDRAMGVYTQLRNENGGSRLRAVLESALDDPAQSWIWSECQACPQCFVLARKTDGCNHLACRCGSHYCFMCGGRLDEESEGCCCDEFQLYDGQQPAYLACWLCFKNESHVLGSSLSLAVRVELAKQMPLSKAEAEAERQRERERVAAERARLEEEAAEEWARTQVLGTDEALQMRTACESLGLLLWYAGAEVPEPSALAELESRVQTFDGLLVNSTWAARVEDSVDDWDDDFEIETEFQYEDEYCVCAKSQRRASHGAPRRVRTEKAWAALPSGLESEVPATRPRKEKLKARVPAHPRGQKQALVVGARQDLAQARRLRSMRQSLQPRRMISE